LELAIASLRRALTGSGIDYEFVVADDRSDPKHIETIGALQVDILARGETNGGLGANCNRGIAACRAPFILQIQDDWEFTGTADDIRHAIDILCEDEQIGIVQLTLMSSDLPLTTRRTRAGLAYRVYANDCLPWRRTGVRPYSDQPHIKSRDFIESIGPYLEGRPMTETEIEFQMRVANQTRWHVAQIDAAPIFTHRGAASSFNPGSPPTAARRALSALPFVGVRLVPVARTFRNTVEHALALGVWWLRRCLWSRV
jgi:hypothetical protein